MLKKRKGNLALELIEVQNDPFGKRLEEQISLIYEKVLKKEITDKTKAKDIPEVVKMEKMIFDRLGLKFKTVCDERFLVAGSASFNINTNSQLNYSNIRGEYENEEAQKLLKELTGNGWVDSKKAKVGGIFSKYENTLYMNFYQLFISLKMTPPQVTAILLHEVGHSFNTVEYSHKLAETCLVMEDVSRSISEKGKDAETYVYTSLKSVYPRTTEKLARELCNDNNIVLSTRLARMFSDITIEGRKGELDPTNERLADLFANRFGYGRELVGALSRLEAFPDYNKVLLALRFVGSIILIRGMINLFLFSVLGTLFMGVMAVPAGFIATIIFNFLMLTFNIHAWGKIFKTEGDDYDSFLKRYKRIRNDMVGTLKNSKLSTSIAKKILDDVKEVDEIMLSKQLFGNTDGNLAKPVLALFHTSLAKDINASEYNDTLNELANNDLFLQSAILKHN